MKNDMYRYNYTQKAFESSDMLVYAWNLCIKQFVHKYSVNNLVCTVHMLSAAFFLENLQKVDKVPLELPLVNKAQKRNVLKAQKYQHTQLNTDSFPKY